MDDRSAVLIIRVWVGDGIDSFHGRLASLEPFPAAEDRAFTVVSSSTGLLDALLDRLGVFVQ